MEEYQVIYTQFVIDFMLSEITSKRVYDKIDSYRLILARFPEIGRVYDPYYETARPPFPCRFVAVPDTPFALYYTVDNVTKIVTVFYIEHLRSNPKSRFSPTAKN